MDGALLAHQSTGITVLLDQASHLLACITADLHEVSNQYPFALFAERQRVKFNQRPLDPLVAAVLVAGDLKSDRLGAGQENDELVNCG